MGVRDGTVTTPQAVQSPLEPTEAIPSCTSLSSDRLIVELCPLDRAEPPSPGLLSNEAVGEVVLEIKNIRSHMWE